MTRIVGRVTDHTHNGLAAWIRLTPSRDWSAAGSGDVVSARTWLPIGLDGVVNVDLVVPDGVTWHVEAGHHETPGISRTGVVIPSTGSVSLAWLLGLVTDPAAPDNPDYLAVTIHTGGLTYSFVAPTIDVDVDAGTFVITHTSLVDNGDGTFTVDATQE